MMRFFRKLMQRQDGAVMAYTAILMPIFIGFIALGFDIASWHIDKRNTQTMADAGAMAAAFQVINIDEEPDEEGDLDDSVIAAATEAATLNGFDSDGGDTIEVNSPPIYGTTAGTDGAIEVIITTPLPLLLSALMEDTEKTAASRAVVLASEAADGCVWALNDSADGAITVQGNVDVEVGCGVFSNSDSDSSILLNGMGACITAVSISAAGGVDGGAGECFDPDPIESSGSRNDPLSSLPEPENEGCDVNSTTRVNGGSDAILYPGTYCGDIVINTTGTVTFEAGLYIMDGADLTINGQATVIGVGVTFFLTDTSASTITINGGADVQLIAPSSGTLQAILIYQSGSADAATHRFNGGADMNMEGIVYTPNSDLHFAGNAAADSEGLMLISDEVTFSGTSSFATIDESNPGSIFFGLDIFEGLTKLVE